MASDSHHSADIPRPARTAGAISFSLLFALESLTRAINSSVVSLQAYDILQSGQKVSMLSTLVSLCVLATSLTLPILINRIPRRWAYTLGGIMLAGGSVALATYTLAGQAAGSYLRNLGASMFGITLSLYILDHFKRDDLTRIEPLRLSFSTASWATGPALGVWLYTAYGPAAPQMAVIVTCGLLIAYFWYLRLTAHAIIKPGSGGQPSPIANVGRFMRQPRLRLAWLIAFGRSVFWATFFIYAPLLMVEGGLHKQSAGWLISASQLLLVTSWAFGRLAGRIGVRKVIAAAMLASGLASIAAGLFGTGAPLLAALALLCGALAASALDAVGGIPFLRAVRHRERPEMTSVYRTFIDCSELLPAIIFTVALLFFPLGAVFVIAGLLLLTVAAVSWRHLPKSL